MILDIVVLAALLISCLIAFFRGFIREVLTILGVLGGALAAVFLGPHLAPVVLGWFGPEALKEDSAEKLFGLVPYGLAADVTAYGIVFVVVVIVLSVISHFLAKGAKAAGLGAVDRSFGVLFGIARAAVFLTLMYLPFYTLVDKEQRDSWFKDSRSQFYIEAMSGWASAMLPQSVTDDMEKRTQQAADLMAKQTREKLEEIDVLNRDDLEKELHQKMDEYYNEKTQQQENGTVFRAPGGATPPGYQPQQRRQMNNLIEEGLNE